MYSQIPSLSKDLATLSYNLDKLAAEIDSVQSHGCNTVKAKKKELSNVIVNMMNTLDALIQTCGFDPSGQIKQ
jgi:prefoldin subunit 5